MPRNVRNFWIELSVDGKQTRIETGPQSKEGGFELTVKMRDRGGIIEALVVHGYTEADGKRIKLWAEAVTSRATLPELGRLEIQTER